jgi:hypothetical protein
MILAAQITFACAIMSFLIALTLRLIGVGHELTTLWGYSLIVVGSGGMYVYFTTPTQGPNGETIPVPPEVARRWGQISAAPIVMLTAYILLPLLYHWVIGLAPLTWQAADELKTRSDIKLSMHVNPNDTATMAVSKQGIENEAAKLTTEFAQAMDKLNAARPASSDAEAYAEWQAEVVTVTTYYKDKQDALASWIPKESTKPQGTWTLPNWTFPEFGGFDMNPQDAPRLIVLGLALILIVFGILGFVRSFFPLIRRAGEEDKDFKARQEERRVNRKTNFASVVLGIVLLFLGTMFVNWALSRIPEQRSVHDIHREALENRRANDRSEPATQPVVTQDVVYSVPRQYNCVDAQFLTLGQPWHHTGFELKSGGTLKVTITSHEVRTAGGPDCPITGCSPTPAHLEGLRTTHHPHMALLGQVGENQIFAVTNPTFVVPAQVVGTGQLKLSHNLRTVLPNGAQATYDWANLEGQVCFQVEVL